MNKKAMAITEAVFDISYLLFAITAGIVMIVSSRGETGILLYGIMAVTLGAGDAFHLVPRIYGQLSGKMEEIVSILGVGKFITSITMTVFYVILYHIVTFIFGINLPVALSVFVYALAAIRIILCLFPQNGWTVKNASLKWAIYRNIPFALLGLVVLFEYAICGVGNFSFIWLGILLSFGFYLPVVLWSSKKPALGALMLPKTLAYVYIVAMGLTLL